MEILLSNSESVNMRKNLDPRRSQSSLGVTELGITMRQLAVTEELGLSMRQLAVTEFSHWQATCLIFISLLYIYKI